MSDVDAGSPAEQAGIRAGDVITTADGKAVRASRDLVAAIRNAGPDTTVELRVVRDKKDLAIRVMLPDGNASRPRRHIPI